MYMYMYIVYHSATVALIAIRTCTVHVFVQQLNNYMYRYMYM